MDRQTFERQHDDAKARASLYTFLLDAWDGTGGFAPPLDEIMLNGSFGSSMNDEELPDWKGTSYIDQFPRESGGKWRGRVRRAHYTNVPRTVGETICGFLLSREPTRNTQDDNLLAFEADADGLGHSWDELLRTELARRLWLLASPIILVDKSAEEAESKAEDSNAYASILYPQSLYDWECDSAGELLWAKLVDKHTECSGADAERISYAIATEWTREGWRRWRMDDGKEPVEQGSGTHPCGRVPLVIGTMSNPVGASILGTSESFEICQEARKLFNYQSLLDDHLYNQVYAVLAIVKGEQAQTEGFKLGTDNALTLPSGSSANYIAPPSSVAEVLFRAIESCIRRIYRAARLEFTLRDTGQAESGVARQYEFSATNRALCSFASELARMERETKRLVLAWNGYDDTRIEDALGESVPSWPDNFDVRDLERSLKLALDGMTLPIGATAKAAWLKTLRDDLVELDDEDREQSDKEIDEEQRIGKGPDTADDSMPPADFRPPPLERFFGRQPDAQPPQAQAPDGVPPEQE